MVGTVARGVRRAERRTAAQEIFRPTGIPAAAVGRLGIALDAFRVRPSLGVGCEVIASHFCLQVETFKYILYFYVKCVNI